VLPANLSDKDSVEALVPAAEAAMGQLDILVNNAGLTRDNLFMRMKDEEWDAVMRVNLEAAFRLMRASLRAMMRRRFGRIVSITSVVGTTGNAGQGKYCCLESCSGWNVEIPRRRGRQPQHYGELRRPGLHCDRDDRRSEREAEKSILTNVPWAGLEAPTRSPLPWRISPVPRRHTSPAKPST
jgi:NAD(P)-dependent dehydrogenase (short-subunit alcohol dehydrogenase family)